MKKLLILSLIIFTTAITFAQKGQGRMMGKKGWEKFEQIEKMKLIETLNMDEGTAIKFFARRKAHMDEQKSLMDERLSVSQKIDEAIENNDFSTLDENMEALYNIEKQMLDSRMEFFNSLKDIFSDQQMAKLLAFDFHFKRELRDAVFRRGNRRP